jgi:serine phosphatase RsbU (regulator of sigma subunit)
MFERINLRKISVRLKVSGAGLCACITVAFGLFLSIADFMMNKSFVENQKLRFAIKFELELKKAVFSPPPEMLKPSAVGAPPSWKDYSRHLFNRFSEIDSLAVLQSTGSLIYTESRPGKVSLNPISKLAPLSFGKAITIVHFTQQNDGPIHFHATLNIPKAMQESGTKPLLLRVGGKMNIPLDALQGHDRRTHLVFGFFTAVSALIVWALWRALFTHPLTKLGELVRDIRRNRRLVSVDPQKLSILEEVQILTAQVAQSATSLAIAEKLDRLIEDTRSSTRNCDEQNFLPTLKRIWLQSGLARQCKLYQVHYYPQKASYTVEGTSEREGSSLGMPKDQNALGLRFEDSAADMLSQGTALEFLRTGHDVSWFDNILCAKATLTQDENSILVLLLVPDRQANLKQEQFEHYARTWIDKSSDLYKHVKVQNLAIMLELSRELQRKWIEDDAPQNARTDYFDNVLAADSLPCQLINGDFLFVHKFVNRKATLVVLGDVTGHELRAGLAATGIVATLSERMRSIGDEPPHLLLEEMLQSINRYLFMSYQGTLGSGASGLYFEHESGQGIVCCFAQPFPLILSEHERKPLVIVPRSTNGMLGINEKLDYTTTPFSLLPGQALFLCTDGLLESQDAKGRKFEKAIGRGALSDITEKYLPSGSAKLLTKIIESARAHAGTNILKDDITCTILMTKSTFYRPASEDLES